MRSTIPLWTTKGPTGLLHWSGVGLHLSKRAAIARLTKRIGGTWRQASRLGYRAVQVRLTEIAPRPGAGEGDR